MQYLDITTEQRENRQTSSSSVRPGPAHRVSSNRAEPSTPRMATRSRIEWTQQTWNPVTGCTNVSPGCKNCYARVFAERLNAMGVPGYEHGFAVTLQPERLQEPLKRRTPTLYFVNSMSDLFHELVPFPFVDRVLDVIRAA